MATINDFGIPDVSEGILHPKQSHRWRIKFVNIGGGTDQDNLSQQLITFKRPSLQFDKIQLDRFNSRSFVAGKHTIEPIDFVLEDDISGSATRVLQRQLEIQQWLIGAEGSYLGAAAEGSQYKFGCRIEMLDGGRGIDVVERITCEGCWLENVDYGDLDYSSADPVKITVTMSLDHFRQDPNGYGGPGHALGGHA